MALKPWYDVVKPREDLREGKPLDASEFAVHLDQIRDKRGSADYFDGQRFFDRTYLTQNLTGFAAKVLRRLSGQRTETSAVFNLATQFGGGKTHALALLYHLARNGPAANGWRGVDQILGKAGLKSVPDARVAVFVGTEFDALTGRGGKDGEPLRRTPWGEIAYQLGGAEALAVLAEHEQQFIEPKGDVIRAFLPKDKPCLILLDEIINHVSTYRRLGYHNALYNFIQALSETARGQDNVVLVVSIPASELEYTAEDEADEQRFRKMLDRLGEAVIMSAESETSQIIRRRLFEWHGLPEDGKATIRAYTTWLAEHRGQLPNWFPVDNAWDAFEAAYPLHPALVSVFERKWQALPRFQRTRGLLRLLALWVSHAYGAGFTSAHADPLIDMGTAPLDDTLFRAAVFEQLGDTRLEAAVTTDICGKADANAVRLDHDSVDAIKKARLHRKVATAVFFESNGGQQRGYATLPEARLAVGGPGMDIANVETVLEALAPPDGACYYLDTDKNRYWFSIKANLNKVHADRCASIQPAQIDERVRAEVQRVFVRTPGLEILPFPESSEKIPNRPALALVVMPPERSISDPHTAAFVDDATRNAGSSGRTYKSALMWAVADGDGVLRSEAKKLLAWEQISDEQNGLRLDDMQKTQLKTYKGKAESNLREAVWRSYHWLVFLGKDNKLQQVDMGLVHSSAAETLPAFILERLAKDGELEKGEISPNYLVRHWPPAFVEWSTKAVHDTFYASPEFPRLLNAETVKATIAKGVSNGIIGYVGKAGAGYQPFLYGEALGAADVEISDDMYIVTSESAEAYKKQVEAPAPPPVTPPPVIPPIDTITPPVQPPVIPPPKSPVSAVTKLRWSGNVPAQKWMNFYMRVLTGFATGGGLTLSVEVEVQDSNGISPQRIEQMKAALRELGLGDEVMTE